MSKRDGAVQGAIDPPNDTPPDRMARCSVCRREVAVDELDACQCGKGVCGARECWDTHERFQCRLGWEER